jgi:phosphate transport system substrate-binding protein
MSVTGPLAGAAVAKSATPTLTSLEKSLTTLENPPTSNVTLTESGSSLFGPLFLEWSGPSGYPNKNISIQPTISSSGTGVSAAIGGTANIGASDPYLPPSDTTVINIPVVTSAQTVDYNIPGLKAGVHLRLNPSVLNQIYTGAITTWDAPQITALNKGITIPSTPIVTIHRSDSSGDTFLFTSYLDFGLGGSTGNPSSGSSFVASQGGPNNQPTWPSVPSAQAQKGNSGMLTACAATTGCIAYIGISYLNNALADHLGYALLENHAGNYVGPTKQNIDTEVASFQHIPTNGAISLIYSTAKSAATGYPIVNFEYAIVEPNQSNPTEGQAIKAFLAWGMDPRYGASKSYLPNVQFQPLAPNALSVAINLLKTIS